MSESDITVCCLFYGDYPHLARRLLESLWLCNFRHLRVGTNDPSQATLDEVMRFKPLWSGTQWYHGTEPFYKYPLMREMFYANPIETEFVMWFDDDSFIKESAPPTWTDDALQKFRDGADMIGKIYRMRAGLTGNQHVWVEDRPWYTGKPVALGHKSPFATGGWWAIRTEILQKWDWPDQDIVHNGGDMMLGELCRQQGYKLQDFDQHLGINANASGRASTAKRRGASVRLVGVDYERPVGDWMSTLEGSA